MHQGDTKDLSRDMFKKGFIILLLYVSYGASRTIKTKMITNENGTKEILLDEDSNLPMKDIDLLIKNLNGMNITVSVSTERTTAPEEVTESRNKTELSENILMKHWNSLTEVGWNEASFRKPIRKMYVNNTRVLEFGAVPTEAPSVVEEETETEVEATTGLKLGRKIWSKEEEEYDEEEEGTTETPEKAENEVQEPNRLLDGLYFIFGCAKEFSIQNGLLRCMASRARSLIYPMWRKLDEGIDYYLNIFETCPEPANSTQVGTNAERAFYHRQKRFLYHILLPLLVIVLIKYLITLPFLLFGMFAAKSLLLSLFSAGTATLNSIAKKYEYLYPRFPVKRYRQVQGVEVSPAGADPGVYWAQGPLQLSEDGRGLGAYKNLNM